MLKICSLHITNRCNNNCRHCFVDGGFKEYDEMSTSQLKSFIEQYSVLSSGQGRINVFGGEPLLREDLFEVLQFAREKGVEMELATGGTVPRDRLEKLIQAKPDYMSFDLDGGKSESHDWLRNRSGHFELMKGIIRDFSDAGLYCNVIMVVNNRNRLEVIDFLEICADLHVREATFQFMNAIGRGLKIKNLVVSAKDWFATYKTVTDWIEKNKPSFTVAWQKAYSSAAEEIHNDEWDCKTQDCSRIFVRANGDVYRCALLGDSDLCVGNIKEEPLSTVMECMHEAQYNCNKIKGCPAISYNTAGDYHVDDPRKMQDCFVATCPRERQYFYPDYLTAVTE